jgi:hypothetical protein
MAQVDFLSLTLILTLALALTRWEAEYGWTCTTASESLVLALRRHVCAAAGMSIVNRSAMGY